MATLRALLVFIAVIFLAAGVTGFGQGVDTGSGSFGWRTKPPIRQPCL